jgi:hypothetical protein
VIKLRNFDIRIAPVSLLLAAGISAHAESTCPGHSGGNTPQSFVGAYGATAVVADCYSPAVAGGPGARSASAMLGDASATATLTVGTPNPGVLTAFASGTAQASASLWDTIHFYIPNPDGGAPMVTLSLSIDGTIAGGAFADVGLFNGSDFGEILSATNFPSKITETFLLDTSRPLVIGAYIDANGNGGAIDLRDPPTLTMTISDGVTYTSASGAYTSAVPEPSSQALLLGGLLGLGFVVRRRDRSGWLSALMRP